MKKLAPFLVALALLLLVLSQTGRRPVVAASPEDCVRAMYAAAREGRVTDYLDTFCAPLLSSLQSTARSMGEEKFRQYLTSAASPIMGMAFSEITERGQAEGGPLAPQGALGAPLRDEASLRCELVFKDRNELQRFILKKIGDRWLIADMTPAERTKPPVPYGTKVYE